MLRSTTWMPPALLATAVLFAGCNAPAAETPADTEAVEVFQSEHHDYRVVTVVGNLVNPWGMAFLPGGDMLVTERPGRVRIVRDGELLPEPVPGLPEIRTGGQGGLLDITLHPEFETNRLVYLSYAKPNDDDSEGTTAVIRARFEGDELQDVEEIFEADAWTSGRGHHGSRLVFDDEGYLFITVGDRQASTRGDLESHPAQDPTNHYGTILRVHDDGSVPDDNPFVGDGEIHPEIWSYGHRNPQGLALHPETDELWETEHGPQGGDELNLIRPGINYGWPVIGYGVNYGAGTPIHEAVAAEGMERPVHHWVPSIATSGLMVYTGDRFPAWRGNIFAGGLTGQQVARISVDGEQFRSEEVLMRDLGRIRDIRQGPDGYIYLAIDDARGEDNPGPSILRVEPAG